MSRAEALRGSACAAILIAVNAYICRTWFFHPTAWMNSLHGYWSAVARLGDGWLHPAWWPFWDLGIPFEYTAAPLVPALAAFISGWQKIPHLMAVQAISAVFYCAVPLALFLLAWRLTRAPGFSFFAGLIYSLLSPAKFLAPEGDFAWANVLSPHRFLLQALWDETPRVAALTFLLLFILFLTRSIEQRGPVYPAAATISLALAILASPFAIFSAALASIALITVREPVERRRNFILSAVIGMFAYTLTACFFPPSMWRAMAAASAAHEQWDLRGITAIAGVILVGLIIKHFLDRSSKDWRIRFFALLAYLMSCGPVLATWMNRQILPQPQRFRIEMDAAIALLMLFGLRPLLDRLPRSAKAAIGLLVAALAVPQMIHIRRLAKDALYPADVTRTMEYRTAQRIAREFPDARVLLAGSMAHWANAFTGIPQFSGSEGTMAYSQVQQRALIAIHNGDARASVAWLKAYGVAAVAVSGVDSGRFRGLLPELWSEEGMTVYRVPQRSLSLAHVVPQAALVSGSLDLGPYNAALEGGLPEAWLEWIGRNRIRIRALTTSGQVISIQASYHPGWHAVINGQPASVNRDALGMMWVPPAQPGPALVEMHYDGGWEFRICRCLSLAALLAATFFLARGTLH